MATSSTNKTLKIANRNSPVRRQKRQKKSAAVKEAGVDDFEVSAWFGVYAPAGTPPDIVKKLNAAIVKIAATDEVNKLLLEQGAQSVSGTPEDLLAQTKKEMARWKAVVDAAGARQ